jgi:predicted dienelactone hydrolase
MLRPLTAILLLCPAVAEARTCQGVWTDPARNRALPVELRLPDGARGQVPVILYSHGLGGSNAGGGIWKAAWERAGFAVLSVQHPGSDSSLLTPGAGIRNLIALRRAFTPATLTARVADIGFVLDRLDGQAGVGACPTTGIDRSRIGMAGHSFGSITTMAMAGARLTGAPGMREARIAAAVALSPSPPRDGSADRAFSDVTVPVMMATGTEDQLRFDTIRASDRLKPFAALPPGGKYLLVLDGATHMDLAGGGPLSNPRAELTRPVIAATTAFWNATLRLDTTAEGWLKSPSGFRATLPESDRFSIK